MRVHPVTPLAEEALDASQTVSLVALLATSCLVAACVALRQGVCPDCEIQRPRKSTGLATTDEPFICIPTAAGNNDATLLLSAGGRMS